MKYIDYYSDDRIGYAVLNRPDKRNALSHDVVSELKEAFSMAAADEGVKVIVLKANGDVFCSGADLASLQALQGYSYEENLADSNHLKDLFLQIYTLPKVVIAQVQGHALAGGCGLATVCDFSVTVPEAKFGYTEVKIGFIPAIVMVFLLRKIGEMKTRQLLLTGDPVSADEAVNMGLISQIVPADILDTAVNHIARRMIETNSGEAMGTTKRMIAEVQSMKLDEALTFAARCNADARASDDCKKGINAFLNKQKLIW